MLLADVSRRLIGGVRFLLNGLVQNIETANLSFTEAADCLNANESWML
jgi:hypothetical protein